MATHSAPQPPRENGEHEPQAPPARTPAVLAAPAVPATGAEGARRVLAVLLAFSAGRHTLTARELVAATAIPLPSLYRYIALLRDTGLLAGDDRGAYHLSPRLIGLARAAEAAATPAEAAEAPGEPGDAFSRRIQREGI